MREKKKEETLLGLLLQYYNSLTGKEKGLLFGILFLFLILAFLGGLFLFHYPPEETPIYPGCFFRELTGFSCAGCGTTRSLSALAKGDFYASFTHNPLLWAGGIFFLLLPFLPLKIFKHKFFWGGALITVFLYTVIRNIAGF